MFYEPWKFYAIWKTCTYYDQNLIEHLIYGMDTLIQTWISRHLLFDGLLAYIIVISINNLKYFTNWRHKKLLKWFINSLPSFASFRWNFVNSYGLFFMIYTTKAAWIMKSKSAQLNKYNCFIQLARSGK